MIVGGGRGITLAVMAIIFTLFLLLTVVIVMGFEEYGPRVMAFLGAGRQAPPTEVVKVTTSWGVPRAPDSPTVVGGARPQYPLPNRALAGAGATLAENPAAWFGEDAYPADAIRQNQQGRAVARLSIDSSGTPTGCTIVTSSRSTSLDSTTCSILMEHARFRPARDRNGVATVGDYTVPVRWVLPED
jgi:TonB family protein